MTISKIAQKYKTIIAIDARTPHYSKPNAEADTERFDFEYDADLFQYPPGPEAIPGGRIPIYTEPDKSLLSSPAIQPKPQLQQEKTPDADKTLRSIPALSRAEALRFATTGIPDIDISLVYLSSAMSDIEKGKDPKRNIENAARELTTLASMIKKSRMPLLNTENALARLSRLIGKFR
jgi:hypothetical protein